MSSLSALHLTLQSGPPLMRTSLLVTGLVFAAWGCSPPCVSVKKVVQLQGACRQPSTTISPNVAFTLEGGHGSQSGACKVFVDGGTIDLAVDSVTCANPSGAAEDAVPPRVLCAIPALPAGTYQVNSSPALTFTIPESADAGVPPCF